MPYISPFSKKPTDSQIEFRNSETDLTWACILKSFPKSRLFKILIWIVLPLVVFKFWLFRWDDFRNGCHIKINPSIIEWNNLDIKRSLKFLREKSPEDYKKTCKYVEIISPDLPCGGSGGGCFRSSVPKQIEISTLGHKNNPALTAAMVVHETCHSIQNEENRPFSEVECYGEMNRMLKEIGVKSPWSNYQ